MNNKSEDDVFEEIISEIENSKNEDVVKCSGAQHVIQKELECVKLIRALKDENARLRGILHTIEVKSSEMLNVIR